MRKQSSTEVFRITGARQSLDDDVRARQRRYVISMSIRTLSFVLAGVLWNVERYVAIVALAGGFLLPYVAVVLANAGRENATSMPTTYVPAPTRPVLPPAAETTDSGTETSHTEPYVEGRIVNRATDHTTDRPEQS